MVSWYGTVAIDQASGIVLNRCSMTGGRPESSCLFYGCVSFEALCTEGLLRVREALVHTEAV